MDETDVPKGLDEMGEVDPMDMMDLLARKDLTEELDLLDLIAP